ncbi:MAG: GNAT family N-acetyltransferase [Actinomycetia bacterium]|nr:GNAT family N-acetyltransferase [Actinomycetes bacterium]
MAIEMGVAAATQPTLGGMCSILSEDDGFRCSASSSARRGVPAREMQYEALFVPPGGAPFPAAIVDQPEIAHYYRNFGASPTDVGRIAASESGLPLGAAWVRLLTGADAGFGHVDDHTPELVIAVTAARRNRGLGAALLIDLLAEVSRCSLSVDARNPAVRLYERVGFTGVATGSDALTMLFDRSL